MTVYLASGKYVLCDVASTQTASEMMAILMLHHLDSTKPCHAATTRSGLTPAHPMRSLLSNAKDSQTAALGLQRRQRRLALCLHVVSCDITRVRKQSFTLAQPPPGPGRSHTLDV